MRTLILGIDYDGRIVQHDRTAPRILAREPDELLGAQLSDLTARPPDGAAAIAGLLEAIRADREGTAMLTMHTRDGRSAEAVVTVHPMRAGGASLAALALLRIPVPQAERFVDPAVMRKQMLDDTFTRIGDTLDIEQVASELLGCAGAALLQRRLTCCCWRAWSATTSCPPTGPRDRAAAPDRAGARAAGPRLGGRLPDRGDPALPGEYAYYSCMDTAKPVLERPSARARRARSPGRGSASRWPSYCPAPPC